MILKLIKFCPNPAPVLAGLTFQFLNPASELTHMGSAAIVIRYSEYRQYVLEASWLGGIVVNGYGIGLVIKRSRVRLPAGALLGSLSQLSLPSLHGR